MPEPVVNLPREVWASIPGHSGYWVSSEGRVRSPRGVLKPHTAKRAGHLSVDLPGVRGVYVHRLVALAFIPNPRRLPMVLHAEDDPANNRVVSLRWGTAAENAADARANGRHSKGPRSLHGSRARYQAGCRCADCTAANTAFDRLRRETNPRFVAQQKAAQRRYYARKKETL